MKKLLQLIIFLLIVVKGDAQVYHPIPTDSVYWLEVYGGLWDAGSGCYCSAGTYKYVFPYASNIIIDGNNYTEFRCNSQTSFTPIPGIPSCTILPDCPGSSYQSNLPYAFIRNDSLNKKVYVYDSVDSHQDIMIYDFDVNVGDTISLFSGLFTFSQCSQDIFVVAGFDSVDIGGEFRKRYSVTGEWSDSIHFIEGIGSNYGFAFNNYCPVEATTDLVCYHYKNFEYYPYYWGPSNCITNLGVESELLDVQNFISKYSSNTYFINNNENGSIDITCYDALGKFILKKSFHESDYLDFSAEPSGIYFMNIIYNGQPIKPYKFIVQH